MFTSINKLPNPLPESDGPNPKAAQALQEGLILIRIRILVKQLILY